MVFQCEESGVWDLEGEGCVCVGCGTGQCCWSFDRKVGDVMDALGASPMGLPSWTYRYFFFEIAYNKGSDYGGIKFEIDYNWVAYEDDVLLHTPCDKYIDGNVEIILPSACRERELTERIYSSKVNIQKARILYKKFIHCASEEERVMRRNIERQELVHALALRRSIMKHCSVCMERLRKYEENQRLRSGMP